MNTRIKPIQKVSVQLLITLIILVVVMTSSIGLLGYIFAENAIEKGTAASFLWIMLGVTAVITIICSAILYFLLIRKVKSLNELVKASTQMAEGNLLETPLKEGTDEIGLIAKSFNRINDGLRGFFRNLLETGKLLEKSSNELSSLSELTKVTSQEIGTALNEISRGSTSQASDIEATSHKANDLQESINKMSMESNGIIQLTEDCAKAVETGKESVTGLQVSNKENSDMLEQISIGITTLFQSVDQISGIVTTIDNISKQTNLLALNASIEAARAGEHGKGFAVVAEEVRKLAEETNQATSQIQSMIQNIEKETESTVLIMAQTTEISNGLNKSVVDTENEFNHISTSIDKIIEGISKLNKEIDKVSANSTVILDSIQNVSAVAEETAASTEQITASVDEQVQTIEAINESSTTIREISAKINDIVINIAEK
ncbi:hypothetical protein CHH83_17540 [Bacillus sp. 7586-K]|nr:hypothetical protein CHH83_17540 [Bacillus sp. 7586-K]